MSSGEHTRDANTNVVGKLVKMKIIVLWDVRPCNPVDVY
jgi:hypothetical protein